MSAPILDLGDIPRLVANLGPAPTADRVLPGPSDTDGWTVAKVAEIAGLDPAEVEFAHRSCETTWREVANRPVNWGRTTNEAGA